MNKQTIPPENRLIINTKVYIIIYINYINNYYETKYTIQILST